MRGSSCSVAHRLGSSCSAVLLCITVEDSFTQQCYAYSRRKAPAVPPSPESQSHLRVHYRFAQKRRSFTQRTFSLISPVAARSTRLRAAQYSMDSPACIADRSARQRRPHRHVNSRLLLSLVALIDVPVLQATGAARSAYNAGDLVILRPSERRPRDFASMSNVTVVVPAIRENVARALPRLLGSIDGQRLVPAETIVVLSGAGEAACKPALRALKQHLHRSAPYSHLQPRRSQPGQGSEHRDSIRLGTLGLLHRRRR